MASLSIGYGNIFGPINVVVVILQEFISSMFDYNRELSFRMVYLFADGKKYNKDFITWVKSPLDIIYIGYMS